MRSAWFVLVMVLVWSPSLRSSADGPLPLGTWEIEGRRYEQLALLGRTAATARFRHGGGMMQVEVAKLPVALREKIGGYDPGEAAAEKESLAREREARAAEEARRRILEQRRAQENAVARSRAQASPPSPRSEDPRSKFGSAQRGPILISEAKRETHGLSVLFVNLSEESVSIDLTQLEVALADGRTVQPSELRSSDPRDNAATAATLLPKSKKRLRLLFANLTDDVALHAVYWRSE